MVPFFAHRSIVLASMHQKELAMAPLLEKALGLQLNVAVNIDTDRFGAFSGETERRDDPLETARKKAMAALETNPAELVISSEGSFQPHHDYFFTTADYEIVYLFDAVHRVEWHAQYVSLDCRARSGTFSTVKEGEELAFSMDFPSHGLVVKVGKAADYSLLQKGILSEKALRQTLDEAIALLHPGEKAVIENDLRAHCNPTRMRQIGHATSLLIEQLMHHCPACSTPGFGIVGKTKGLPCGLCGTPTQLVARQIYRCQFCQHEEEGGRKDGLKSADPQFCDNCNP
jgi:hypothetical protein